MCELIVPSRPKTDAKSAGAFCCNNNKKIAMLEFTVDLPDQEISSFTTTLVDRTEFQPAIFFLRWVLESVF